MLRRRKPRKRFFIRSYPNPGDLVLEHLYNYACHVRYNTKAAPLAISTLGLHKIVDERRTIHGRPRASCHCKGDPCGRPSGGRRTIMGASQDLGKRDTYKGRRVIVRATLPGDSAPTIQRWP